MIPSLIVLQKRYRQLGNIYADIPEFRNPSILTGDVYRPDLLLVTPDKSLYIVELTVGYETSGVASSIIEGVHIHIFVFTDRKNNTFQKRLITQNTNI